MRLHFAQAGRSVTAVVSEFQFFTIAARARDERQGARIDRRPTVVQRQDEGVQRGHAAPQTRGQDLFQLRKRAHRRFYDSGHGAAGGRLEPDCDRDGFLVVELSRWSNSPDSPSCVTCPHRGAAFAKLPQGVRTAPLPTNSGGTETTRASGAAGPRSPTSTYSMPFIED